LPVREAMRRWFADALLASGQSEFIGLLDDDRSIWGSQILGYPVIGPITAWSECKPDGVAIAIEDNGSRKQLFEQLLVAGATLISIINPSAVMSIDVKVGRGVLILANVVVNS